MITITNKNIYYSEFPLSTLNSIDDIDIINVKDIVHYLSDYVELGESVTFKRLFEIASSNSDKFNNIFYSTLGGFKLDPYFQEIENNKTEITGIDYIEVYWYGDKFDNDLNISPSIQGISKKYGYHSLDFTSLNNIKDFNIKINKNVEILDYNKIENKETEVKVYLGEKMFTLFELFNGIFLEISFHGGPQDKNEKIKEIEDSISQLEIEELKDAKVLSITFEDVLEKYDENDEYLVVYKKFRDRVDEDRITDIKNLDKLKLCLLEKIKIFDKIINSKRNLKQYYKLLTDIEYNMQMLYGEKEDIKFHQFWETPKCTCPKIDNLEIYPSDNPIFNPKCPIHKKTS